MAVELGHALGGNEVNDGAENARMQFMLTIPMLKETSLIDALRMCLNHIVLPQV